eukprot:TRINITY_DN6966_c0_g1_i1.p1 TRINITY_DN6966_c0_g1~~TRINITY_DN6966_c0_g1_i1.p1  ORF type:complete len:775 (+),score=203.98 TRINITY_DN6966_c0_g1_i1:47-2371(+)
MQAPSMRNIATLLIVLVALSVDAAKVHVPNKSPANNLRVQQKADETSEDVKWFVQLLGRVNQPYSEFEPTCIEHLKKLETKIAMSYTSVQSGQVLRNECRLSEEFPDAIDDGFTKQKVCERFAKDFDDAMGQGEGGLKSFCRDFYTGDQSLKKKLLAAKKAQEAKKQKEEESASPSLEVKRGSVHLKDGRIVRQDGTIVNPDGSVTQGTMDKNGDVVLKDGTVVRADGTVKSASSCSKSWFGWLLGCPEEGAYDAKEAEKSAPKPEEVVVKEDGTKVRPDGTQETPSGAIKEADGKTRWGAPVAKKQDSSQNFWGWLFGLDDDSYSAKQATGTPGKPLKPKPVSADKDDASKALEASKANKATKDGEVNRMVDKDGDSKVDKVVDKDGDGKPDKDGDSKVDKVVADTDGKSGSSGRDIAEDLKKDGSYGAPGSSDEVEISKPKVKKAGSKDKDIAVDELNPCLLDKYTVVLPDGSMLLPNKQYRDKDGDEKPAEVAKSTAAPQCTRRLPDGTLVFPDGSAKTKRGKKIQTRLIPGYVSDETNVLPDGTVILPDGTMVKPDGSKGEGQLPPGTLVLPDGRRVLPDGTVVNADGTPAKGEMQEDGSIKLADGTIVRADGTIVNPDGTTDSASMIGSTTVAPPQTTMTTTMSPLDRFMPGCVFHFQKVAKTIDHSYTDMMAEAVLKQECLLDKDFPKVRKPSKLSLEECNTIAVLFGKARRAELRGDNKPYKQTCLKTFEFTKSEPKPKAKMTQTHWMAGLFLGLMFLGIAILAVRK